jgi:polygalacturonase
MSDVLSIVDFGAKPDTLCTQAIQAALDQAGQAGGGTVHVPPGRYISGTIELRSGVTLDLHPAAVLQASDKIDDFPKRTGDMRNEQGGRHFVLADGCQNVTLTGGGTLDGNGEAFWEGPRPNSKWIKAKPIRVSPMLELRNVRNLVLDDIRVINSPGWTIHPFCCDDVTLRGVRVSNHMYGPNTDGIDIDGCRDVFISDCILYCGDDAIIIKAKPEARSTERVLISNCVVKSNCIGIGIGQETESDVRQVTVTNCVMYQCHRMFTIGIWAGGTVEDVTVSNCVGDTLVEPNLSRPIQIEVKQHAERDHVPLGFIRNVQISNFIARGAGRCLLTAQEGTTMDDVVFRDVHLHFPYVEDADKLSPVGATEGSSQYANRNLEARRKNAAVVVENARRMTLDNLNVTWPDGQEQEIPFGVLWARHVDGLRVDAPFAQGLFGGDAYVLDDVTGEINGQPID